MKTLIALITCHSRGAYADAQRDTWVKKLPENLEYRFFLGPSSREPKEDEVFLDCDDSYGGLPSKVRAVVRWAVEHGYDYVVKIDDDTVLNPSAFLNSGYERYDFTGHVNDDKSKVLIPWGFLYVLSKRSMEIMAQAPLPPNNNDEAWTANTLVGHGIGLHNEPRYYLHRGKRRDFIPKAPRPLRAPPRLTLMEEDTPGNGIAYAVFLHWSGFHATPDEVNIKEYYKLYKETQ